MSDERIAAIGGLLLLVLFLTVGSLVGWCLGYCHGRDTYQGEAIERGFAGFDSKTGKWRWNE